MIDLLLVLALGVGLLLVVGLLYQAVASARDRRRYPPPGRCADVDGRCLHLLERGEGDPAVVLDSALGGSSMSWYRVQPELARMTRVVAHDRAGFAWSDATERPRTADALAEELHALLQAAAIAPPVVLVGHSYGTLVSLLYAARYPGEVGGLVLVDPPDVESWSDPDERQRARIARGARLARRAAMASRFGLMRLFFFLFGLRAAPASRLTSPESTGAEQSRIFDVLEKLPQDARAPLRWFWSEPRCLDALASLIENVPVSTRAVAEAELPRDLPLLVLTASDAPDKQRELHRRLASRSTRGRQIQAAKSGHWIPIEEPELVIDACREMVDLVREGGG